VSVACMEPVRNCCTERPSASTSLSAVASTQVFICLKQSIWVSHVCFYIRVRWCPTPLKLSTRKPYFFLPLAIFSAININVLRSPADMLAMACLSLRNRPAPGLCEAQSFKSSFASAFCASPLPS
jgi:hypothetical protein